MFAYIRVGVTATSWTFGVARPVVTWVQVVASGDTASPPLKAPIKLRPPGAVANVHGNWPSRGVGTGVHVAPVRRLSRAGPTA